MAESLSCLVYLLSKLESFAPTRVDVEVNNSAVRIGSSSNNLDILWKTLFEVNWITYLVLSLAYTNNHQENVTYFSCLEIQPSNYSVFLPTPVDVKQSNN